MLSTTMKSQTVLKFQIKNPVLHVLSFKKLWSKQNMAAKWWLPVYMNHIPTVNQLLYARTSFRFSWFNDCMEINWFVAANFYDNDVAFVKNINQRHLRIGLHDKKHRPSRILQKFHTCKL